MAMQQKQVKKQQRRRMGTAMAAMTNPMYAARVGWHDGGNCGRREGYYYQTHPQYDALCPGYNKNLSNRF